MTPSDIIEYAFVTSVAVLMVGMAFATVVMLVRKAWKLEP
jgi:hypothetical protein